MQFNSAGPLYGSSFALVYPYAAAEGVSGGLVNAEIPQRQKAVSGSYDPSAALSVTAADDLSGPDSDYSKGLIRTIAGKSWPIEAAGNPATDLVKDAAGTDAVFIYPEGMALSPDGNTIYMVDGTDVNCRIRKITYTQN